jgi:hypothetical protein
MVAPLAAQQPVGISTARGCFFGARPALAGERCCTICCVIPAPPIQQIRVDAQLLGDLALGGSRLRRQPYRFPLVLV